MSPLLIFLVFDIFTLPQMSHSKHILKYSHFWGWPESRRFLDNLKIIQRHTIKCGFKVGKHGRFWQTFTSMSNMIKLPTSAGLSKKQESSRKTSISALLAMPKPLTVWITTNCGKFWERWEYQATWPASWKTYMQVRKQQLELDMEQQTGFQYEKEYIKAVYCHLDYLTSMQSTSWETLGCKKHKLESRLPGEISITSDMQMTPLLWQKVKRN